MTTNGGQMHGEVTRDVLGRRSFWQPAKGYRFNIDSVLLADFATPAEGPVADLCAGCGIVGLLLAVRGLPGPFLSVELDALATDCARRNWAGMDAEAQVLHGDLTVDHELMPPGGFKLVVCNPPYVQPGQGRVSPIQGRDAARTGLALEPDALWDRASKLLKAGDRFALSWPPMRLVEALSGLMANRLTPKRLRLVHGRTDYPAKIALIEAVKDGGVQLDVEPPLIVRQAGNEYTDEVKAIYEGLGLF